MPIDYKETDEYSPETPPVRTEVPSYDVRIQDEPSPMGPVTATGVSPTKEPSAIGGGQAAEELTAPTQELPSSAETPLTTPEMHTNSKLDRAIREIELTYESKAPKRSVLRKPDPWLNIFLLAVDAYTGKPTWLNQLLFERPLKQKKADEEYKQKADKYQFEKKIDDQRKEIDIAQLKEQFAYDQSQEKAQLTKSVLAIENTKNLLAAEKDKLDYDIRKIQEGAYVDEKTGKAPTANEMIDLMNERIMKFNALTSQIKGSAEYWYDEFRQRENIEKLDREYGVIMNDLIPTRPQTSLPTPTTIELGIGGQVKERAPVQSPKSTPPKSEPKTSDQSMNTGEEPGGEDMLSQIVNMFSDTEEV